MLRKPFKSFNFLISNALTFFLKNFEADGVERDEGITGTSFCSNTTGQYRLIVLKILQNDDSNLSRIASKLWKFDHLRSAHNFGWCTFFRYLIFWNLLQILCERLDGWILKASFFFESAVIEFKASLFCTCCDWYKKFNFVSIVIDTHLRVSICRYEFQFWEKKVSSG